MVCESWWTSNIMSWVWLICTMLLLRCPFTQPSLTNNKLSYEIFFVFLETLLRRARGGKALIEAAIIVACYCISVYPTCIVRTSTLWILLMHIRLAYQPSLPRTLRIVLQSTEELSILQQYREILTIHNNGTNHQCNKTSISCQVHRWVYSSTPLSILFVRALGNSRLECNCLTMNKHVFHFGGK
jgi:hypothetical protein